MAWDKEGDQSVGVKQGDIYIVDAITLPQWIYSTYILFAQGCAIMA
jgi:hypothetical protein